MDDARPQHAAALRTLVAAARVGGDIALRQFRLGDRTTARVSYKAGDSPVTSADLEVDAELAAILSRAFPLARWLSEESDDDPARLGGSTVIIVDPIDGTRAYLNGDPCWTVSIALVENGRPIAGVVHAPALGETFAAAVGHGATLNDAPIPAASLASLDGAVIAGPRHLSQAFATQTGARLEFAPRVRSLAYRLASVAGGRFALALAGPDSHDWDIAAADVILSEAGAGLLEGAGEVRYNRAVTSHGPLLAAPANWLQRLAPALDAAQRPSAGA